MFPHCPATSKKVKPSNTNQLPQCISSTCKLLRNILEGSSQFAQRKKEKRLTPSAIILEEDIIDECQRTFIHCFHAFCPTSQLKWVFFCELLGQQEKVCCYIVIKKLVYVWSKAPLRRVCFVIVLRYICPPIVMFVLSLEHCPELVTFVLNYVYWPQLVRLQLCISPSVGIICPQFCMSTVGYNCPQFTSYQIRIYIILPSMYYRLSSFLLFLSSFAGNCCQW